MSVIRYSKEEVVLALAACWDRGSIGSTDNLRYMGLMAEAGDKILVANGEAYKATYSDGCDPEPAITAADIKRQLICATVDKKREGMRVFDGLRYNLIANNGQDFADMDILDWLFSLQRGAYRMLELRVSSRAGAA